MVWTTWSNWSCTWMKCGFRSIARCPGRRDLSKCQGAWSLNFDVRPRLGNEMLIRLRQSCSIKLPGRGCDRVLVLTLPRREGCERRPRTESKVGRCLYEVAPIEATDQI